MTAQERHDFLEKAKKRAVENYHADFNQRYAKYIDKPEQPKNQGPADLKKYWDGYRYKYRPQSARPPPQVIDESALRER